MFQLDYIYGSLCNKILKIIDLLSKNREICFNTTYSFVNSVSFVLLIEVKEKENRCL